VYKEQRIRDPIHNLISFEDSEFEDVIWQLIQTRPFQRLRRIKQLGFSDLVYPGATHSRFAHSVGVFHTARQLMGLIRKHVGRSSWSQSKANAALAASLVHDVGHGPFSHAFEEVGRRLNLKLADHEHVSDQLIRDSDVAEPLKGISSGFHNDVADVIKSKGPRSVYDAVVSSQFDADRLDYMRRDRLMAGSSHGVIDYDWLVSNLQVDRLNTGVDAQKVGDIQTFVIGPKGVYAAEAYVLGLFQLYPTIYFHKTTRGVEKLFTELLVRVFELALNDSVDRTGLTEEHPLIRFAQNPTSVDAALCLDDSVVYGALSQLCEATDKAISNLAVRIRDRKLFKCYDVREAVRREVLSRLAVTQKGDGEENINIEKSISRVSVAVADKIELWKRTEKKELLLADKASRPPYKRFEESKGPLNQIMVRDASGSLVDLADFSPVVRSIPTFEVLRYYYNSEETSVATKFNRFIQEEIKHGI
jgi:HD superfamily phosphohydrolase